MNNDPTPESFLPLPHLPLHILLGLAAGQPAHGWAIIKRIGEMTQGRTSPSSGSLYLAMVRLGESGLIEQVEAPSSETDARRRFDSLTRLGRGVLRAETERLSSLVDLARLHEALDGQE